MFPTVPLSIVRSFSLYTQQWYMSYRFDDSLRTESGRSVLILLASCHQSCMTYTIAVCTAKNSWRWTEELTETCRVLFQKYIWEISTSSWFYYKKYTAASYVKRKELHKHNCNSYTNITVTVTTRNFYVNNNISIDSIKIINGLFWCIKMHK